MNIREYYEDMETSTLSLYAVKSKESRGRLKTIEECPIRTVFQRDRDRIIHAKSFRRLMHKTQVFLAPEGDHYRTRLTHTLEVSQIARTMARALRLNEDLTEAIALSHDLGHTPFGHSGETALNQICKSGFKHYEQSLRVVDVLEGSSGMNLTFEVRDGIINHAGDNEALTLEGKLIKMADRIAYINHDIDDAVRGGIISEEEIPKDCILNLGESHGVRLNTMISDIIENSMDKPEITMSENVRMYMMKLRSFMFENVYTNRTAKCEDEKAKDVLCTLFGMFVKYPERLPKYNRDMIDTVGIEQSVCDYIAGMTDNFAIQTYYEYFIPRSWSIK